MSTGQRQRVKLAQAIAADPSLVLLDEPTDGLDPVQRDEMLALIRQISAEYGIDVLLSGHLLEGDRAHLRQHRGARCGTTRRPRPLGVARRRHHHDHGRTRRDRRAPRRRRCGRGAAPCCGTRRPSRSQPAASPQPTSRPASARSATPSPPSRRLRRVVVDRTTLEDLFTGAPA